jgi:15-cis-phytoene desaturase
MRVLVLGGGLAGLSAAERLLDERAEVVVVDSFPLPGGRVSSFEATVDVAGLIPGDIVEHGLHAWFQHYEALFGLMARAGLEKPKFAGKGIHFFHAHHGHTVIEGGPYIWLINALRLPRSLRGPRTKALAAFGRLIRMLERSLENAEQTDRESAASLLARVGVPDAAVKSIFRPCLFSLTSLPLEELSALELLRWMSNILPDPRIRCIEGGGTQAMCAPIAAHLRSRGADFRFGVEVKRLYVDASGRVRAEMRAAPDRTGLRHVLVQGFEPAPVPDAESFDAIVSTLPWERLVEVARDEPALVELEAFQRMRSLKNVHPLTIRLWFERPLEETGARYVLCDGTVFDVMRPTPEPHRYPGVHLVDALIDNVESHIPGFVYRGERYIPEGDDHRLVMDRVLKDLESMYPGQIQGNRVVRSFLHTREGIIACRPGVWSSRPAQYVGRSDFVIGGDFTRQAYGVCMEGAVRSGHLAVQALMAGHNSVVTSREFTRITHGSQGTPERASPRRILG